MVLCPTFDQSEQMWRVQDGTRQEKALCPPYVHRETQNERRVGSLRTHREWHRSLAARLLWLPLPSKGRKGPCDTICAVASGNCLIDNTPGNKMKCASHSHSSVPPQESQRHREHAFCLNWKLKLFFLPQIGLPTSEISPCRHEPI